MLNLFFNVRVQLNESTNGEYATLRQEHVQVPPSSSTDVLLSTVFKLPPSALQAATFHVSLVQVHSRCDTGLASKTLLTRARQ